MKARYTNTPQKIANTNAASTVLADISRLQTRLEKANWKYSKPYVTKPRAEHNDRYVSVFTREIPHPKALKASQSLNSIQTVTENLSVTNSNTTPPLSLSLPKTVSPSSGCAKDIFDSGLGIGDIESIQRMRMEEDALVIALDTEFYYTRVQEAKVRRIITWQVAFVEPSRPEYIQQIIFSSTDAKRISLSFIITYILEHYNVQSLAPKGFEAIDYRKCRRYVYHTIDNYARYVYRKTPDIDTAIQKSGFNPAEKKVLEGCKENPHKALPNAERRNGTRYIELDNIVDGYINCPEEFRNRAIPIVLLCHAGIADLSTFDFSDGVDIQLHLSNIQGGLVTLNSFGFYPSSASEPNKFFPINLTVRDTMCYAPANKKTLDSLGKAIGVPKIMIPQFYKENMLLFLRRETVAYADYAINDSVVTLCYAGELWGYNKQMPITVSSAAAKAAVPVISAYFGNDFNGGAESRKQFDRLFRGLERVNRGLIAKGDEFVSNISLEPINDNAKLLQLYAESAYKGGYNACTRVGKYDGLLTHDFDLENAYATAMSLVPDVNWCGSVLLREFQDRDLTLDDFESPLDLMFGYISFEFPKAVRYPCLPISENGSVIFPRTSEGLPGVYACGPEIYLALKQGARVTAKRVFVGCKRINGDGSESHSLLAAVKQLINDRTLAKKTFGKDSVAQLLIKMALTSLYGKTAQNVIKKRSWDVWFQEMTEIGASAITSPVHACMTTAIVRCVLLAAMNQLEDKGYRVFSVTTDGFITDADKSELDSLDLYGFAEPFRRVRQELAGTNEMWSEKHCQTDLLNFTTRGNVSLSNKGVCAHNSFVTGYEKDSRQDRLALMITVLSRTGKCPTTSKSFTTFKELSDYKKQIDFSVEDKRRDLSMDFDLKRKPIRSSMRTVNPIIDGVEYEIANFDTEPYDNLDEYKVYKSVGKGNKVLRTVNDWNAFFLKAVLKEKGIARKITDLDWERLRSCVMGHRMGLWTIGFLNRADSTLSDKLYNINIFNQSADKSFTKSDWDNCIRQDRQRQLLPKDMFIDLLQAMQEFIGF
ncbi:hypothetical protein [Ruminococcus sp.]|uniref:hypothetical protein n=1 Tax=Ruminococcus sp. TaxID=41978 RepID=UPI0025DC05D2|nr:hypothetical protein [Ruminococcus sp.]MBQ8965193.1 hypothetical protein [Ruminococcus sp.]